VASNVGVRLGMGERDWTPIMNPRSWGLARIVLVWNLVAFVAFIVAPPDYKRYAVYAAFGLLALHMIWAMSRR
jgi:hypothetical protein